MKTETFDYIDILDDDFNPIFGAYDDEGFKFDSLKLTQTLYQLEQAAPVTAERDDERILIQLLTKPKGKDKTAVLNSIGAFLEENGISILKEKITLNFRFI